MQSARGSRAVVPKATRSATPRAARVVGAGQRQTFWGKQVQCASVGGLRARASSRMALSVAASVDLNAVTVSDTKKKFLDAYAKPIPALYSTIIQELLVQAHLIKFGAKFEYDKVFALGFLSVYDGIMDSFPGDNQDEILSAFTGALGEDKDKMRKDVEEVTAWASGLSGVSEIAADANGSPLQQEFVEYASGFSERTKVYNKFFGVGMFRLLELASCTDPASLEKLSTSLSVPLNRVTSDLATYKGMLSKMTKAKELMQEIVEEQRKKAAQREAEKAEKAESTSSNGELPNGGAPSAA